jgi:hypothetical protein
MCTHTHTYTQSAGILAVVSSTGQGLDSLFSRLSQDVEPLSRELCHLPRDQLDLTFYLSKSLYLISQETN